MEICHHYKEQIKMFRSKMGGSGRNPPKPTIEKTWICDKSNNTWVRTCGNNNIPCAGNLEKCVNPE